MSGAFEPEIGSVIEFQAGEEHRLGVITGTVGKKKFVLYTVGGEEMRTTASEITFGLGKVAADDPHRCEAKLTGLGQTIQSRQGDVEIGLLWEFVREDPGPYEASELAELIFSDEEPATVLATIRALRGDRVYFKARRDGKFEPRPPEQVEAVRAQVEAEERRRRQEEEVSGELTRLLEVPEEDRAKAVEEALGEKDRLRDTVHLLQEYAAQGPEFLHRDAAEEALDRLVDYRGRSLKGTRHLRAFYLMVELGLFEEHENLAMRRARIGWEFSGEVLEEAERVAEEVYEPEAWRRDLRGLTTVTIDAESSRDLDDGLSCQDRIEGGLEVYIHIADPSARVKAGTLLDEEARRRGTSVYLPEGTVPMFPERLSEGVMSLTAGEVRPAVTTRVVFDEDLEILETEVMASVITVDRRMSYDEVDEILQGEGAGRYEDLLQKLRYVAEGRYAAREEQGAMGFDLPETRVRVEKSEDPPRVEVEVVETETASRMLVSELMILNNEVVGRFCSERGIPVIYRIQEPPEEPLDDAEILSVPQGVARAFAQIRRMKPGELSSVPGWHFGLGTASYAQASSPIRRYADLACQRQIKAHLRGEELPYSEEEMLELLAVCGGAMGDATQAEREGNKYWILQYLATRKGESLWATVVEHKDDAGTRVAVFLEDCAYRFNGTLRAKIPVGDRVQVVVERVDPRRESLSLKQAPG